MTQPAGTGAGNRLLAALPPAVTERLDPLLEEIPLRHGYVLQPAGTLVEHAVFPDAGVISLVADFGAHRRAEVGLVGPEGVAGLAALFGDPRARFEAQVQVAGRARRIPMSALRPIIAQSEALRMLLMRYAASMLQWSAATTACNALHPLPQRTARWLLALHDRAGDGLMITQEYIAQMLGARRTTVNAALRRFVAQGLVRTTRGRIAIADPAGLEQAACPCRRLLAEG